MTSETTTAVRAPVGLGPVAPPEREWRVVHPEPTLDRFPSLLRAIDALHRGNRSLVTYLIDLGVLFVAGLAAGATYRMTAGLSLVLLFALYVGGVYGDRSSLETRGIIWFVSAAIAPIAMTILGAVAFAQVFGWMVTEILLAGIVGMGGIVAVRAFTATVLSISRRRGLGLERTLVVGDSRHASMVSRKLTEHPQAGLLPIAIVPRCVGNGSSHFTDFPEAHQLSKAIVESGATHVVLAPEGSDASILECVKGANGLDVTFSMLPPLSELFLHPKSVAQVGGLPLIPLGRIARSRTSLPGKRLLDFVLGSLLLILAAPLLAITALAIKIFDGGPVIYRQRRVGRYGSVFQMLKFRSMVPSVERLEIDLRDRHTSMAMLFKVNDAARITPIGRVIRRTAIDELPQLWNVIRGDMSLVGPRPTPGVNPEDFNGIDGKRLIVPPGMTGFWQVSGDNALTYEEMVKLDLAYVENWSLWLDILLLFRTIPALLHRRGPS